MTTLDSAPGRASSAPLREGPGAEAAEISPAWVDLGLIALVVAVYLPTVRAGFIFDDDFNISNSPLMTSVAGLRRIWLEPGATLQYHPLQYSLWWLEHHLFGDAPAGYHAVNLGLQAVNALLLVRVLRGLRVPAASLAAAVFAVHPVGVETVAWITEQKNLTSSLFALLTVMIFIRERGWSLRPPSPPRTLGAEGGFAVAMTLAFSLALLSKSAQVPLPGALLLLAWWKEGRMGKVPLALTLPMWGMGAAVAWVSLQLERGYTRQGAPYDGLPGRLQVAGVNLLHCARELILPIDLEPVFRPRWDLSTHHLVDWTCTAAVFAAVLVLWSLRARIGRGPLAPVLYFCGMLLPCIGLFPLTMQAYTDVSDHLQYPASVGLIALMASGVGAIAHRWRRALATAWVLTLGGVSWTQLYAYRDAPTFWTTVLESNPESIIGMNELGRALVASGRPPRPSRCSPGVGGWVATSASWTPRETRCSYSIIDPPRPSPPIPATSRRGSTPGSSGPRPLSSWASWRRPSPTSRWPRASTPIAPLPWRRLGAC